MALQINTPYITVADADTYLGETLPWENAETEDKEYALQMGRAYIDQYYSCAYSEESNDPAPDAMQIANADLANLYLEDPSSFLGDASSAGLTRNRVKAGSVESEKEFDTYLKSGQDLYPSITVTLTGVCTRNGSMGFVTR